MCVFTKRIMRAATFPLFVLFGVAGMFFLLDYTYLGASSDFCICRWYHHALCLRYPVGIKAYPPGSFGACQG